ncbi:unnamed protein product [Moneuplotes crassus]|uniref:Uncharacterized protein n=1 Tax=Euplotes crassus TaxID=5936 RepID=A0AAD1X980_EUPCR|nr:unnamed protein product [Moneuplotes crassus]
MTCLPNIAHLKIDTASILFFAVFLRRCPKIDPCGIKHMDCKETLPLKELKESYLKTGRSLFICGNFDFQEFAKPV